jgi:hypothetical protein
MTTFAMTVKQARAESITAAYADDGGTGTTGLVTPTATAAHAVTDGAGYAHGEDPSRMHGAARANRMKSPTLSAMLTVLPTICARNCALGAARSR